MLTSALREYDRHQRLVALAVAEAARLGTRGAAAVARTTQTYQAAAVALSLGSTDAILSEQGISTARDATVAPTSLLTGVRPTLGMLAQAASEQAMLRLVETLVTDASRTARSVDQATRPAVTGYVRSLRPPSCGRCAVLAGRVYRYSHGFQRHPRCDCLMMPTDHTVGPQLVTNPSAAFNSGQIHGLSKADAEAVAAGADIGQVVNAQRKASGLTVGSSVMIRAGRLTPAACLARGGTREGVVALLRQFGYIAP